MQALGLCWSLFRQLQDSGLYRLIFELSAGAVSLPMIAVFTNATTGIPSGHFGSSKLANGMVGRRGGMTESILP